VANIATRELASWGRRYNSGRKVCKPPRQYFRGIESITKLGRVITPNFFPPFSYCSFPYIPFHAP